MKTFVFIFILLLSQHLAHSQITDTIPAISDSLNTKTEELPVLKDTVQYNDTVVRNTATGKDTIVKKRVHSPQKATILSAIMPGLGQIYNRKYWKLPIVYGAIGFPTYLFFYNKSWYNKTRYALSIVANGRYNNQDSLNRVDPQLKPFVVAGQDNSSGLLLYRNEFRKNLDYSILVTLIMWGLNVVDATVDAHLKGFDVSDDLSLNIRPTLLPGTMTPAVSLVLTFK